MFTNRRGLAWGDDCFDPVSPSTAYCDACKTELDERLLRLQVLDTNHNPRTRTQLFEDCDGLSVEERFFMLQILDSDSDA